MSESKKRSVSKHCLHCGKNPCCCPTPSTPSNIQFAFTETQEAIVVPEQSETTFISLLPITTTGQNVKLDLSFEIRLISPPSDVVDFRFQIRRNGSILVQPRIEEVSTGVYSRVIALTFVDVPPPGTQTYDVVISNFLEVPFVVEFRALTATLYPPENVLPSTNL